MFSPLVIKRITKYVRDEARREAGESCITGACAYRAQEICEKLFTLLELCGPFSQTRRAAVHIAKVLFDQKIRILIPICTDYRSMPEVPDLFYGHLNFLEKVRKVLPEIDTTFLVPKQEAEDWLVLTQYHTNNFNLLCKFHTFRKNIEKILLGTPHKVAWFEEVVPSLKEREHQAMESVRLIEKYKQYVQHLTLTRKELYRTHSVVMLNDEQMMRRTQVTSAQYLALGGFARDTRSLICNHTTKNLSWYRRTHTGVLHNTNVAF